MSSLAQRSLVLVAVACAGALKRSLSRRAGATHDAEAIAHHLASRERILDAYSRALAEPTRLVQAVAGAAGDVAAVEAVRTVFDLDEEQALAAMRLSFDRAGRKQVEVINRELAEVRTQLMALDEQART